MGWWGRGCINTPAPQLLQRDNSEALVPYQLPEFPAGRLQRPNNTPVSGFCPTLLVLYHVWWGLFPNGQPILKSSSQALLLGQDPKPGLMASFWGAFRNSFLLRPPRKLSMLSMVSFPWARGCWLPPPDPFPTSSSEPV